MTETTAHIEVVCPGMLAGVLDVLSVGKGDLRLTVGGDDPAEITKAKRIIEGMLAAGYGIFVETDKGLTRVRRYNPKRSTYVISGEPDETVPVKSPAKRGRPRKTTEREVPVAGSKAVAVGRTAGG